MLTGDVGTDGGQHFVASVRSSREIAGIVVRAEHQRHHDAAADIDAQVNLLRGEPLVECVECCVGAWVQRRGGHGCSVAPGCDIAPGAVVLG